MTKKHEIFCQKQKTFGLETEAFKSRKIQKHETAKEVVGHYCR